MTTAPRPDAPPQSTVPDLPIHELLALEAVSRLGSVQAAADDLNVTPSGISHRIASLEQRIGRPLLQRRGRGVVLTDVAEAYVETVRPGLTALAASTETLLDRVHRTVRIASAAAVGATWLLPLLQRHARQHPELRYELLTVAMPDELPPDRWDILIHYGKAPRRGAERSVLFTERLCQVCAPGLQQRTPVLRLAQLDVPKATGLQQRSAATAPAQLVFDDALAMLEAASAGAGVAWSTETAARP